MHVITKLLAVAGAAALAGCAGSSPSGSAPSDAALAQEAQAMLQASFKERGMAKLDRLVQDDTQSLCSRYAGGTLPKDVAQKIEQANMALVKPPSDGQYLGNWQRGEQVAQRGTGFQYSDTPETPVGGNCYACHQLSKQEISYGTIGPSLYNFGKIRGYTPEMQKYAWGKVYNAHAYAACSNMPRYGAKGILSEQQIKDVVALLMDPKSPVNQ